MVKLAPRFSIVRFSNPLLGEVWLGTCLVLVHGCLIWKLERNVGLDRCCSLIPSMTEKIFVTISLIPWSYPIFLAFTRFIRMLATPFAKNLDARFSTIFEGGKFWGWYEGGLAGMPPSPCYAALLRHLTLEAVPKPPSPLPSPPLAPAASPVASLLLASRDYFCNMPATVWVEND